MKTEYLGLRTLIYKVTDLAKAKDWYTKALGIKPYFDEVFYVGFNVGGYELGLIPNEDGSGGGATTYWGVGNVQKAFDELISNGATAYENPNDVGGDIVVAAVKDPWGNPFGIIYNPHFKIGS